MDIISFRTQRKTSFVVTWIEQTFFSTTLFNYPIDSMTSFLPYALSRNSAKTSLSFFGCKGQRDRICDDNWTWLLERTLELKRVKLCLSLNISCYKMCDFTKFISLSSLNNRNKHNYVFYQETVEFTSAS